MKFSEFSILKSPESESEYEENYRGRNERRRRRNRIPCGSKDRRE